MVVEASRAIRERITKMITSIDVDSDVIEAELVNEAINLFHQYKPGFVLLDLLLPDGHGLQVLKAIKECPESTSVLVMSNDPNDLYKKRSLELGATYFFDKVKDFDKVIQAVEEILVHSSTIVKR